MKTSFKTIILAAILPLIFGGANSAFANGANVTVENGDSQTGSVTGSGIDTYNYGATSGRYLESGTTDTGGSSSFYPYIGLYRPGGTTLQAAADGRYGAVVDALGTATTTYPGTWVGKVENYFAYTSGAYSSSITESVTQTSLAGPRGGGDMTPGLTVSGSVLGGNYDVYSFQGVTGGTVTVSLTGGGGTKLPYVVVVNPSGTIPTGGIVYTATSTTSSFGTSNGTYTVFVSKYYDDSNTVSYTLEVSGSGVAPPTDGKNDGYCAACQQAAQSATDPAMVLEAGDPVGHAGSAAVGYPINVATGNMYEQVTDYSTVGTNPLAFIRTYNSQSYTRNIYASALGPNWRHNYDRYIRDISASQATAERPDGRVINFTLVSSVWTPDADADYTLTKSGSTWTLTGPDDVVETYTESSGKGTLNSIAWPNGYTQTLTYTTGKLTSVSDSYSRTLTLSDVGENDAYHQEIYSEQRL